MIDIQVIKLSDFIHDVGEDEARSRLSSFSCGGLNDEVEHYLRDGAFRHSRKKTSITYLVMAAGDAKTCLAYYTLAVKPFSVKSSRLTARQKKEMKDLARICISREDKSYGIASYLIGQLAKNYAVDGGKLISGRDLVGFIIEQIRGIRDQVGGKVVFLEYEKDRPKLKEFYKSCAFEEFKMPSDAEDGERLGQLFCFLNEKAGGGSDIDS